MAVKEDVARLFNYLGQDSSDQYHEFVQERGKERAQAKWPILKAIQIAPKMINIEDSAVTPSPAEATLRSGPEVGRSSGASSLFRSSAQSAVHRQPAFLSGLAARTQPEAEDKADQIDNTRIGQQLWSAEQRKPAPWLAQARKPEQQPAFLDKMHEAPAVTRRHPDDTQESSRLSAMFARLSEGSADEPSAEKPQLFRQHSSESSRTEKPGLFTNLLKP